jgi:ADP-L-glycero-D-manno-heptose 6-epimerase
VLLLTGASGFIGSNLVARLNETGRNDVILCDDLGSEGKWRNLQKHEFHDFVPIAGLGAFLSTKPQLSAVIHLGANSSTIATDGDEVLKRNFACSVILWEFCARQGIPLLYASSAATYGGGERGFLDDDSPDFLTTLRPINLYGWSKHAFDRRAARDVAEGRPTPPRWYGLKFFNVYGPNEYHKIGMHSAVLTVTNAVLAGGPARLFGSDRPDIPDGGQSRDFVFVDDICDVMLWMQSVAPPSGLYNLGSGRARSFADLAHAVFAALGQEPRVEYVPMPEALQGGYQYWTEAHLGKLRRAGYNAPMTSLEDGVARYVRGFLSTHDRYR